MKRRLLSCGILATSLAAIFAFVQPQRAAIVGRVSPADGANSVWAISGTDSVRGAIAAGSFSLPVKNGVYKVIVDAKEPYKDVLLDNIEVKQDQPVDVGEIVLQQ